MLEIGGRDERFDFFVGELFAEEGREFLTKFIAREISCGARAGESEFEFAGLGLAEAFDFEKDARGGLLDDAEHAAGERMAFAPEMEQGAARLRSDLILEICEGSEALAVFADLDGAGGDDAIERFGNAGGIGHRA